MIQPTEALADLPVATFASVVGLQKEDFWNGNGRGANGR